MTPVPFFRILIHGDGINVPCTTESNRTLGWGPPDAEQPPIVGFYTTRYVRAPDVDTARKKAIAAVAKLWSEPPFSEINRGKPPVLSLDEMAQVDLWRGLFGKPRKGHIFYGPDPEDDEIA